MNQRALRILMLSWEFPPRIIGGIARHVDELSRALAAAGHRVDVLTAHHPGAPSLEEIPAGEGKVRVLRAEPQPLHPLDFITEIHQLEFGLLQRFLLAGERQYDVIHAHDWLVAFAARTLRFGLDRPMVATIHATEAGRNGGLHTPTQRYIHSVEWLLTYDAWRVVCCSHMMSVEVQGSLHTPADKVRIIPNGVDPARMKCQDSPAPRAQFRARWARPEERILFFVGRLVREKGIEVLLEAMPAVLAAHPDTKLVIAGGGPRDHLVARAVALGIAPRVVFTGFLPEEDLPRAYAVADLAVFPSLYEPFGIVAIEAMAAGVPVVVSDAGGFREVVRPEITGLHTWANNPSSLAWGINRVLGDAALAAKLRKGGLAEAATRFSWEGIAAQTIAVYEEACALPAAPRSGPGLHPRYAGFETMGERGERS